MPGSSVSEHLKHDALHTDIQGEIGRRDEIHGVSVSSRKEAGTIIDHRSDSLAARCLKRSAVLAGCAASLDFSNFLRWATVSWSVFCGCAFSRCCRARSMAAAMAAFLAASAFMASGADAGTGAGVSDDSVGFSAALAAAALASLSAFSAFSRSSRSLRNSGSGPWPHRPDFFHECAQISGLLAKRKYWTNGIYEKGRRSCNSRIRCSRKRLKSSCVLPKFLARENQYSSNGCSS